MVARTGTLHAGRAEEVYCQWPAPDLIVSDGAYGVGGFPGDPRTPERLDHWYAEHVAAWSMHAKAATTLWFWNTEIGWATVHPLLAANGPARNGCERSGSEPECRCIRRTRHAA